MGTGFLIPPISCNTKFEKEKKNGINIPSIYSTKRISRAFGTTSTPILPCHPTPVLNPMTKEPVTPDFLSVLFPMGLIEQEVCTERYIDIPEEVREAYKL